MKSVVGNAIRSFNRARFAKAAAAILDTPPLALGAPEGAVLATMLQHKDVLMYLVALKTFARTVPVTRVVVINDGSLSPEDLKTLNRHIPELTVLGVEAFRSDFCPVGGCWERLLAISELSRDAYVVQLDADTLALGDLAEVRENVLERRSFTIGTWDNQEIEPMSRTSARAKEALRRNPSQHVQLVTEASFDRLSQHEHLQYVRGCAGFMGFAPGSLERSRIEAMSSEIRSTVGPVWDTWGSEQVMANIMLANASDAVVLPHPAYCACNRVRDGETRFVHFIGSCRFANGMYMRLTQQAIRALQPSA